MKKPDLKEMLESILTDIAIGASVDTYKNKLKVASAYISNENFSSFVDKEFFDGYTLDEDYIPEYRMIDYHLAYEGYVSPMNFEEDLIFDSMVQLSTKTPIIEPIPTIIDFISIGKELRQDLSQEEEEQISYPTGVSVCKSISDSDIKSIKRAVDKLLIEFIIKLNKSDFNGEIDFNVMSDSNAKKSVTNNISAGIIQYGNGVIDAKNSTNTVIQNSCITISQDNKEELKSLLLRIEQLSDDVEDDREDIAEAISSIRIELNKPKSNKSALNIATKFLKSLLHSCAVNQLSELMEELVLKIGDPNWIK